MFKERILALESHTIDIINSQTNHQIYWNIIFYVYRKGIGLTSESLKSWENKIQKYSIISTCHWVFLKVSHHSIKHYF